MPYLGPLDSAFEPATLGCFQDVFAPFAAFEVAGFGFGEVVVVGAFDFVASVVGFG